MLMNQPGSSQSQMWDYLYNDMLQYLANHGYQITNSEEIERTLKKTNPRAQMRPKAPFLDSVISYLANLEKQDESKTGIDMPKMYDELVEFIKQVPDIQSIQLKPLLFAFFYHTIVSMHIPRQPDKRDADEKSRQLEKTIQFFEKYTKYADDDMKFHSFHESDIKKFQQNLQSSILNTGTINDKAIFHASLTETTYQALVAFLMDKSFMRFLIILRKYVKVNFVPLDHFTNRLDEQNFIYHSTYQEDDPVQPLIQLLNENPYDLAKKFVKGNDTTKNSPIKFDIFDDDPTTNRIANPFPLPPVSADRIAAIASDLRHLDKLSKTVLPSCAYFTFQQDNIAYDINYNGTLLAVATNYGYVQLFATCALTDIDDKTITDKIIPYPIVPRQPTGLPSRNMYTRHLLGPRTYCCKFSPESRFLLCTGASTLKIWSCEHCNAISHINYQTGIIWCADWSPLGYHFVIGTDDKCSLLYSFDREKPIRMFVGHQDSLTDIKFHPNAATIASASYDRSVMLWDIREEKKNSCTRVFAESNDVPMSIQFSRNGRVIISGDEMGKITTWDIGEGRKIGSVKGHKGEIRDMTVSIEGTLLASAGSNGEIALWDMATLCSNSASSAEPLKKLTPRNSYTHRVSFSSRNLLHAIGSIKKS
ncbi:hypothetical protein TRFO_28257 [Tritrichomonas foetus]|uniref:Uncharacterized protein n=1 Tax=Tritrichomonas foetus TaxID=1144522 RepID=A0A1J4K0J4_9EUKA|nr:hypothetical protein TRFO_28257 [Tritrichomonas foetus]|eukprot:OHT04272.1 hypothetical protein TRFO_28257 [Tritrichomonas foetus]